MQNTNKASSTKLTRDLIAQQIFKNEGVKGFLLQDCKNMLESIIEHIKYKVFGKGKILKIRDYGRLTPKIKPSGRPVRNPQKGDTYTMEEIATVTLTKQQGHSNKDNRFTEKQFLTDFICSNPHLTKSEQELAAISAQTLFNVIRSTCNIDVKCEIRGLAVFSARMTKPRQARNPKTGETVFVPAKVKPVFSISREYKKELHGLLKAN